MIKFLLLLIFLTGCATTPQHTYRLLDGQGVQWNVNAHDIIIEDSVIEKRLRLNRR